MMRVNNFDGLRLLAALAVMVSHQFIIRGDGMKFLVQGFDGGQIAVGVFLAISGFLVSASWTHDPDVLRFTNRRLLRVWPAMAVLVVVSAIGLEAFGADGLFYLHNLTFAFVNQDVFTDHRPALSLNPSLWTIQIEVACYLMLVLARAATRWAFRWLGLVAIALWVVWFFAAGGQATFVREGVHVFVLYPMFFLIGALIEQFDPRREWLALGMLIGAGLLISGNTPLFCLAFIPCATILIGIESWPFMRDAGRYGDFSYGIYLWGYPMQQMVIGFFGYTSWWTLFGCSLVLTGTLAWLSWTFVEKPSLSLKPKASST